MIQRREIELQLTAIAELLDCFDEHQIGRAGTKAHIRLRRDHEKFPGFKMRRGLQFNLGEMRNGIFAAARHPSHLVENEPVVARAARNSCEQDRRRNHEQNSFQRSELWRQAGSPATLRDMTTGKGLATVPTCCASRR